jgi:hypothetical protein
MQFIDAAGGISMTAVAADHVFKTDRKRSNEK